MMLFFRSITRKFNDIDIMISEQHVEKVKEIMTSIATPRKKTVDEMYQTKSFFRI